MTRSARRRWSRDLEHEVDGIAVAPAGPVVVHGYEPPAGGRWVDSAIPGRLTALERNGGDVLWSSPCEVGYGRGFGAGFGGEADVVLVGPSAAGHRIARMSLATGELLGLAEIPTFDEAVVDADLCLVASARSVTAIDTRSLSVRWRFSREGERYHRLARNGSHVFVSYTHDSTKKQGLLRLKASSGAFEAVVLEPIQPAIPDLTVDGACVALLVGDLAAALPREQALELLLAEDEASGEAQGLGLVALEASGDSGSRVRWFERLGGGDSEEDHEVAISSDSDKLYLARGTLLEVRDGVSGRQLGEFVVPGLDDRVGWQVCQGAGLLAEEKRVSVFELLA